MRHLRLVLLTRKGLLCMMKYLIVARVFMQSSFSKWCLIDLTHLIGDAVAHLGVRWTIRGHSRSNAGLLRRNPSARSDHLDITALEPVDVEDTSGGRQ